MENQAFSFMNIPKRSQKPRNVGITMMIDYGIGVNNQKDLINIAEPYIDIAKIAVGLSGILNEKMLMDKISIYQNSNIETFIGGQFLEFGIFHQGLNISSKYFSEAKRLGFKLIEISDNNLKISQNEKMDLIKQAKNDFGLKVLGEVGSKTESSSTKAMIKGIQNCLSAGAWKVFLEAAEFISPDDGHILENIISEIMENVDQEKIILELPGRWISNVHGAIIHDMSVFLIDYFGADINIANVGPGDVIELEALRLGVGAVLKGA
jgi:phosphosulfolactate synthase